MLNVVCRHAHFISSAFFAGLSIPAAAAEDASLSIELSYERLDLPDVQFGGSYNWNDPAAPIVRTLQQETAHSMASDAGSVETGLD